MEYVIKSIEEVKDIPFEVGRDIKITLESNYLNYHFRVIPKNYDEKLLVFSNGAVDVAKKQPPVFMRHSWQDEFKSSLVYLDDPTIHGLGLKLGWGQGRIEEFALEVYSTIIIELAKSLQINDDKVFYYGSSAGGFMSLVLSAMHKKSKGIVNNPQTDIKNYSENFSVPLLEKVYGSVEKAYSDYLYRVKATEAFVEYDNIPEIYYCQNRSCSSDMKKHYTPFLKQINDQKLDIEKVNLLLYHDKKAGHNPLKKEETVHLINSIMQKY